MNEVSNFQNGESENVTKEYPLGDVNNPVYKINNWNSHQALNYHTTAMDCLHSGKIQEYNAHNLFGFLESIATHNTLISIYNKRPFVLSRSSFAGSGKYTAHWLGDNQSTWESLRSSIAGILDFNMFGVPFVGADICGFTGVTNEELCARWSAVGAFYPFSRNHHDHQSQEPYNWPSVTTVAIKTLNARYSILPYYYTLFYYANQHGGQVARALWFSFPTDLNTWPIDQQFMIGGGILISPVLTQGATSVRAYFPEAKWYNFWDGTVQTPNGFVTLNAALTDIPIHVQGGHIIPMQEPGYTIADTRANPFKLLVPLNSSNAASGSLYLDDGESVTNVQISLINYAAASGTLTSTVTQSAYGTLPVLNTVVVLGVAGPINKVTVNGGSISSFNFSTSNVLTISSLSLPMLKPFTISWGA